MPRKNSKNKQSKRGELPITALAYNGPIGALSQRQRDDTFETVCGVSKPTAMAASVGAFRGRFFFRNSSSGAIPSTLTGDFFIGAPDMSSFSSLATDWASFRVLALKVTIVSQLRDSTTGFHGSPVQSTVIRDNGFAGALADTPAWEIHPVSTTSNLFTREMRMDGVDEAEWVDSANAYTAISPQPSIVIEFPYNPVAPVTYQVSVQYRVQFRNRV